MCCGSSRASRVPEIETLPDARQIARNVLPPLIMLAII
jgi:hypothetical protein